MLIAKVTIDISRYMVDGLKRIEVLHTVNAQSYDEGEEKIHAYYESKDMSYDTTHYIRNIEWAEHIE